MWKTTFLHQAIIFWFIKSRYSNILFQASAPSAPLDAGVANLLGLSIPKKDKTPNESPKTSNKKPKTANGALKQNKTHSKPQLANASKHKNVPNIPTASSAGNTTKGEYSCAILNLVERCICIIDAELMATKPNKKICIHTPMYTNAHTHPHTHTSSLSHIQIIG